MGNPQDQPVLDFNNMIVLAASRIQHEYGGKGYHEKSDFTNNFAFGPFKVRAFNPPFTMCVSFQFELILTAINLYVADGGNVSPYNFLKKAQWFGLNGMTLQNCVWENEHCHSVGQALSLFGMGETMSFEQLSPGSFVSYDHSTGGHSVCFLGFLDADAKLVSNYSADVAGFRFIASNGSGFAGEGISCRDGVLLNKHMKQGEMRQSTGIHNMRGGVMHPPSAWHATRKQHFSAVLEEAFAGVIGNPPTGQE